VAVVVTFNRLAQIKTTLARLLEGSCDHVVVVDNGSDDGTRDWLAGQGDARLELILADKNLGGAGGFEVGMRAAVDRFDPDWLVVMDDDARPNSGTLAAFLARDHQGVDAVAAAVRYPDGRICEMNRPSFNPFRHRQVFLRTLFGAGRRGFHLADAAYQGGARSVDAASFVGLFLSRKAVSALGYPDGRLFLYGDDVIYTLELTRRGFCLQFDPRIRFEHDCTTFKGTARIYRPLWKAYYTYRNGLILYRKASGWMFWPLLLVVVPKWIWNGRLYGANRRKYYRLLACAVVDGVRGEKKREAKGR
jgi:GT2 family glycosyltransferase